MGKYRTHQRTSKKCSGCGRGVAVPHAEGCAVALAKKIVRTGNIQRPVKAA